MIAYATIMCRFVKQLLLNASRARREIRRDSEQAEARDEIWFV
jgi:hypothetical protein